MVVLRPAGDMAMRERDLIIASTALMLLIILPVMIATLVFARHYRAGNTAAGYDPNFHHSTHLEVLIWTAPLMIVIALGALTWISTHILDPYRPLARIDGRRSVSSELKPLTVEAVSLDWKWLFFYPDQGIATVNELAAPIDVPINFKITSGSVMNTFSVPTMAGMIYAMAGMETKLHAVLNKTGTFDGQSAHYSGAGFSHMNFKVLGQNPADFDKWVAKVRAEGKRLDQNTYLELEKPTEKEPVHYYASVWEDLYKRILNLCAVPGKMCHDEMMRIDAAGGGGKDSGANYEKLTYDSHRAAEGVEAPGATFPASGRPPNSNVQPQGMMNRPLSPDVNKQPAPNQGEDTTKDQGMPGMPDMPGMKTSPAPVQLNQQK